MKNQGVGARSSLGYEDFTDRFRSKAQPAEAVDRFRWESDQIALLQNFTGFTNGILGNGENPGLHRWRVGEKDALGKLRTFFSTCPHRGLHAGEVSLSPKDWQAVVREAAARAVGEDVGWCEAEARCDQWGGGDAAPRAGREVKNTEPRSNLSAMEVSFSHFFYLLLP